MTKKKSLIEVRLFQIVFDTLILLGIGYVAVLVVRLSLFNNPERPIIAVIVGVGLFVVLAGTYTKGVGLWRKR